MYGVGTVLRGLDVERYTVDELIELRAGARVLELEYQAANYEVPEWLKERTVMLDAEIKRLRADTMRKRVRELVAQKSALRTADEKRADVDAELARLQAELGETVKA